MSDADEEVRLMAARAIEFLSTHPNNKEIVANHPGLVDKMVLSYLVNYFVERVRRIRKRSC